MDETGRMVLGLVGTGGEGAARHLTSNFKRVFGEAKPVIAMVHLGALPGTPLHDEKDGIEGLVRGARKDLLALQKAGVDAVMFGNENDRPYEFAVDTASTTTMAYVIGRLRPEITVPFGGNVLWDPMSTMALAAATGARFAREIFTGSYASDMGPWNPDAGKATRYRDRLGRSDLALLYNVSAEFAYSLDRRPLADRARSAVSPRSRRHSGIGRDHRRGCRDGRPRSGEEGAARHPGACQYRRQARDGRRCAARRRRLHRRLVAEGRRPHLERRRPRSGDRIHGYRAQSAGA